MSYDDWRNVKLEEIVEIKGGKRLPKGHSLVDYKTTHPYIRVRDLNNITKLEKFDGIQYIIEETFSNISRYITNYKDVLLSIVGTIGLTGIVGKTLDNASLTENCVKLTNHSEKIDYRFLYYYLNSPNGIQEIRMGTVGAVQAKLPIKNIKNINVVLPPLAEQKTISNILSSLDDKIELNNKINKNLEEMAQALYKQWFVDFEYPNEDGEPYKSSGGEMIESDLGLIPRGWEVGSLGDLVATTIAGDWGKEAITGNYTSEVVCIRGADINSIKVGDKGKCPTRYILNKNFLKKKLKAGDIVVEISGGSPKQSTGRTALISKEFIHRYNDKVICTNFCRAIEPKDINLSPYISLTFEYLYNNNVFFNYENGTTGIKNFDLKFILNEYKIVIPNKEWIDRLASFYLDTYEQIQQNGKENEVLTITRDTLLPKLMSGEIEVPIEG